VRQAETPGHRADVFYIHPTTYSSSDWNQRMGDGAAQEWTLRSVAERQASAFADCCRLFMPFYRQASSRAFVERDGRGAAAYELAYDDVRAAFRHYLSTENHGRPFILAGHSQGALLGLWLLQREIAGTPASRRLVAAYLPGIGIPISALPAGIPTCLHARQTGCAVSWNSFTEAADTAGWSARAVADYGRPGADNTIICINPVTFSASRPRSTLREGKAMLPVAERGQPPQPAIQRAKAARCENGVLRIALRPGIVAPALPNGSLHMHDIALFWGDLSANAKLRSRHWRGLSR